MDMKALIERFPKKVWVGTFEFPVHFVEGTHEKLDKGELNGCALFDQPETAIYFCESLPAVKLLEIVWHEFTHAVNYVSDIEDGVEEETICEKHGKAWSQFWIQNPRFARWWLAACIAVRKEQSGITERKKK
jgi:hypothetical protein